MENLRKIINFYKKSPVLNYKRLKFARISGKYDVYNPSGAFEFDGKEYLFGRIEKRKNWANSRIMLFKRAGKHIWKRVRVVKSLKLEDPFIQKINGEFVLGGVSVKKSSGKIEFKTVFYRGKTPFVLRKFAEGPLGMKDIRLVELENRKVGIFTRPQGGKYKRGKIGFLIFDSLNQLNENLINNARLINFPFLGKEWGGVNHVIMLKKGVLGVLGHIAYVSKDNSKFYYPISFRFNIKTRKISDMKLLFSRKDLPFGLPKNKYLYNVIFPGGIICKDEKATIYAGVGDSESYEVEIRNPFV